MFEILFTPEAIEDLRWFGKTDRRRILAAIDLQLTEQPLEETRNRKRLRPNRVAEWELRLGVFRVFYDVVHAERLIRVLAVGYKEGSCVYVRGEEYSL